MTLARFLLTVCALNGVPQRRQTSSVDAFDVQIVGMLEQVLPVDESIRLT